MKSLKEILNLKPLSGQIGIEVEAEGANLQLIDTPTWKTEDDGSLRGMFPSERSEYVLKKPVTIRKVEDALDELIEAQKEATFNFSHRCSVHVHINVSDLTEDEFLTYLYLALLLEEPLMSFCGEERQGNHFCLRVADAEGYVEVLQNVFSDGGTSIRFINENTVRYAAINIASVRKYGSLEFRGMRGTLDKEVLLPWIKSLYRLKTVAKIFKNPIEVHNAYVGMSNSDFAKKCFGKLSSFFVNDETVSRMNRSYSLTVDLPHSYRFARDERELLNRVKERQEVAIEEVDDFHQAVQEARDRVMQKRQEAAIQLLMAGNPFAGIVRELNA